MTDAPATNELLALADRMETHVVSRLPGSEPVVTNGAWQMMLDAAKALRAAATPSAQGAGVSVEELARELIRADATRSLPQMKIGLARSHSMRKCERSIPTTRTAIRL